MRGHLLGPGGIGDPLLDHVSGIDDHEVCLGSLLAAEPAKYELGRVLTAGRATHAHFESAELSGPE